MFDVNHGEFEELTITAETKQHYVVLTGTPRSVQANGSVFDTDMDANRRCGTIRKHTPGRIQCHLPCGSALFHSMIM